MSAIPTRETVSREHLLRILNEQLSKHDVCGDCQFMGPIYRLREPDENGCNWSEDTTLRLGGSSLSLACARAIVRVMDEARQSYNISD